MANNLITGGAGFIGSHLAEYLLDQGEEVVVLDNLSTGRFDNIRHLVGRTGFQYIIGDLSEDSIAIPAMEKADTIYHLAAAVGVNLKQSHAIGCRAVIVLPAGIEHRPIKVRQNRIIRLSLIEADLTDKPALITHHKQVRCWIESVGISPETACGDEHDITIMIRQVAWFEVGNNHTVRIEGQLFDG